MAGEPKIDPMELIFGTLTVNVLTNRLMDEKMPILDNSYPDLAYPMQPTQNVVKTYVFLTVVFCYTFLHSELVASDMPAPDQNYL